MSSKWWEQFCVAVAGVVNERTHKNGCDGEGETKTVAVKSSVFQRKILMLFYWIL